MRNCFLLLFLLAVSVQGFAQKGLLFYNTKKNKTILVKEGMRASILYKGYKGQTEFAREIIREITDSTITLGVDLTQVTGIRPGKINSLTHKIIRVEDIVGFRRMGTGRQIAKTVVAVGGVVGSFYLLRNVYRSSTISSGSSFLISLGVGLGLVGINELLFPENIKYYMEDGWQVKVIDQAR
jgi:predicted phage tail protein